MPVYSTACRSVATPGGAVARCNARLRPGVLPPPQPPDPKQFTQKPNGHLEVVKIWRDSQECPVRPTAWTPRCALIASTHRREGVCECACLCVWGEGEACSARPRGPALGRGQPTPPARAAWGSERLRACSGRFFGLYGSSLPSVSFDYLCMLL